MAFVDLNDSLISQVRQAADIVEFIGQVTPLKQAGKSYKGLCPFHREKSPSSHVDRAKGLFYCFGCGTGGDVFKFLVLTERFTFPEAVEHVASRVGIDLPRRKQGKRENDKDDLLEAIDEASEAFHRALKWTPNAADEYLKKRRVPQAIIEKYGFGFAPDSWDYIYTLLARKHGDQKLEQVGLVMPRKGGNGFYDRFRSRLMIPIHSETGALLGFGGRSLDGGEPKYLNSPESDIFNKSRILYNLHRSKDGMRRIDRAILVEGYFDAIAVDHAGVPGAIASMGTSLTAGQASLIRRYARRVVIAYDGDDAGRNATLRAAQVLLSAGLEVQVLDLQGEKDPDSLMEKHGVDRFLELLGTAADVFHFALKEWGGDAAALTGREKAQRIEQFVPLLSAVPDPVVRNDAAQKIADAFRLEFDVVWSRIKGKAQASLPERQLAPAAGTSAEKMILSAALQGRLPVGVAGRIREDYFGDPGCRTLFSVIKSGLAEGLPIDFEEIKTHVKGEAELTLLSELTLSEDVDDGTLQRIDENLRPMERQYLERRQLEIQREIVEAEKAGDEDRLGSLWREKLEITRMSSALK
ncbi:MAG: primase [Acidobacteria bacterium]|nr:primase [Acidobacteriota bacterium]